MDLSKLKWPIIIVVVVGVIWLFSSAGIEWQYKKYTSSQPGTNAEVDKINELGLSRLGGFLMKTFRYKKAEIVLRECCDRFPSGDNYWQNYYRMVRLVEKQGRYEEAVQMLEDLMANNAHELDDRVPANDVLQLRTQKLKEVHDIGVR